MKYKLRNAKDKIKYLDKSGVYKIKCDGCEMSYIGETRRKLKVRLRQHSEAHHKGNIHKSSVAEHMIANTHLTPRV